MATSSVQNIEQAITQLSAAELDELYTWLADYQPQLIDDRIAADLDAGLLDGAIARATRDAENGSTDPL